MNPLPNTFTTKLNRSIIIREAISKDCKKLLALKLQYLKETNSIPLFDYEYTNSIAEEETLIKKYQKERNSTLLVAENNGQIIGNIDLTGSWRKKMQHTAVIGMGIHTDWQNQGVGTLFLQNVIDWAIENQILKNLWLEVYSTNTAGIELYKKIGFQESGRIPGFFHENETYIDKITMFINV